MKSLWTPWTALILILLVLGVAILNGVINFDAPDVGLTGNDIRPPNVRSFRINGVRVGDVIAVIDSVVLTPAKLEDPDSMTTGNTITFDADISDENRVVEATLTLFRLRPLPMSPMVYETFDLLEAAYRLEWDASDAPNGLYGGSIKVIDENQNEATVFPNVQLALLRFGGQASNTSAPPAANATTSTPATGTPATGTPTSGTTTTSPTSTPTSSTPATTPAPANRTTTPAVATQPRQTNVTLRRRDLVFAVLTTVFALLFIAASRLFLSRWSN
jgi:hypothetical protein